MASRKPVSRGLPLTQEGWCGSRGLTTSCRRASRKHESRASGILALPSASSRASRKPDSRSLPLTQEGWCGSRGLAASCRRASRKHAPRERRPSRPHLPLRLTRISPTALIGHSLSCFELSCGGLGVVIFFSFQAFRRVLEGFVSPALLASLSHDFTRLVQMGCPSPAHFSFGSGLARVDSAF